MARVAVIYHSAGGTIGRLADAVGQGATDAGATVRLAAVADPGGQECQCGGGCGCARVAAPSVGSRVADLADLDWADALVFGTPALFGNIAAPLKRFLESALPLWTAGQLADKLVAGFTSAGSIHGGHETTLLALYQTMYHWGCLIVPTGYTSPEFRQAGGNPYGVSASVRRGGGITDAETQAARILGRRVADFADRVTRPALATVVPA